MRVTGIFKFMGAESRPGVKDPTKTNFIVGFSEGMDVLRLYVEPAQYAKCAQIPPYTDVIVELDYNPVAQKVPYCMRFVDIKKPEEV